VPPEIAVSALGPTLLAISVVNFVRELGAIGLSLGPVLAVSIDATLSRCL
jgi:uncharacterized protein with von Willebrand factor type A (vWA) domain